MLQQTERIPALDSLRGIAAFIVLAGHCYLIWPETLHEQVPLWLSFTPMRLLFMGHSSVIMFFVLSGYVLTLPFLNKQPLYGVYLIKRICRIYLPFACAILLAALLYYNCPPLTDGQGSSWLRKSWGGQTIMPVPIFRLLAMTGEDKDMWLDGPMWSLVYEMRISILFPLLVLFVGRAYKALIVAAALYVMASAAAVQTGNGQELQTAGDFAGSFLLMFRFMSFFIIGITLAKHDQAIKVWLHSLPRGLWTCFLLLSLAGFSLPTEIHNQRLVNVIPMFNGSVATKFILEFTIGVASSFLIVSARNMNGFSKLLNLPTIKWLGKVSYSLYLIHLPIAFFLFRALLGKTAFANIVILVICTSLACSEIFYQLVERPSIRLGMALSKRIE